MKKLFIALCSVALSASFAMQAAKPTANIHPPKEHTTTHTIAAARAAAEASDMNLAAISRTNPFELVGPGAEILGQSDESSALANDMLGFARRFMGVRYVHGGRSPKGFDCSGFTSYVYANFGMSLSPSSKVQATQGRSVKNSEVQPGDILVFTGRGSRSVGHVGLAISADPVSGEITFIHAARSGIRIDKTSSPYYAKRFIGARRILPD